MNTNFVLFNLALAGVIAITHGASLTNVIYARYVCSSKPNGLKTLVPGSCSQYYECQFGRSQLHSCPRYFDGSQGRCVVSNTGCIEPLRAAAFIPAGCSGPCCGVSSGYVLDPINPQVYYKCRNNCADEEQECDGKLVFNLVKLECDKAANCGAVTTPETPTTSTESTSSSSSSTTCASDTTSTTTCTTTASTTTCKSSSSSTTSCTTTATTCITTTPSLSASSNSVADNILSNIETSNIDLYVRFVCRGRPDDYLLVSLKSCNEYYICRKGFAVVQSCGNNYFNALKGICDLPENTNCNLDQDQTGADTMTNIEPSLEASETSLSSSSATSSKPVASNEAHINKLSNDDLYLRFVCRDRPDNYLLVSLKSCNEYYVCRKEIAVTQSCGDQYFNAPKGICDLPEHTKCSLGINQAGSDNVSSELSSLESFPEAAETSLSSSSATSSNTVVTNEPASETSLSSSSSTSSKPTSENVAPINKPSNDDLYLRFVCRDRPDNYILVSLKSCNEFYVCREGIAVTQSCGDKYFNAPKGICDLPEHTKCSMDLSHTVTDTASSTLSESSSGAQTSLPSSSATSINTVVANEPASESSLPSSSTTSSNPTSVNVAPINKLSNDDLYLRFVCRDRPDNYLLVSLKSCNEYYVCREGIAVSQSCGDKYFNAAKAICDVPENTKCILDQV